MGKTTIATEIGLLLGERKLPHALIDLDWLGWVNVGPEFSAYDRLIVQNLAAIWPNLRSIGVEYLVLARGLAERDRIDDLRQIFPEASITAVRLMASPGSIEQRLRQRDQGEMLREHLQETLDMTITLDRLGLQDAAVLNDGDSIRDVAAEVLRRAGWK